MREKPRILALAGSLRRHSYNRRVLKVAGKGAEDAGAEVTYIDLRDYPMPIYNPDYHERNGFDENALRFQDLVARHDGFLIATPEYNGSLPAALKNAIDWASRQSDVHPKAAVFPGKVAAMISASPGSFGGLRSLAHLRGVLTSVGVNVLPKEVAVSFVADRFDGDGEEMNDDRMKAVLEGLGASLVEMVRKVRGEAGLLSATCG
ncbi:MAG TPA: NAD(P)H-dependent oxidoreductase [Blastocatellia bacterium]|nr:NAD(P)H-dependent oxidoreductase [Blastocatellia bacterium]